jgi:hypothetical protein
MQPGVKNSRTLILIKAQQHHFLSICSVFSELFFSCLFLFSFVLKQQYKTTTAAAALSLLKRSNQSTNEKNEIKNSRHTVRDKHSTSCTEQQHQQHNTTQTNNNYVAIATYLPSF